ncbi:Uncharacterised protein [Klebsiella pneumoniae]|uniref:Uncharacterized protein n=1 Tax=Klebsiella pneumoniae TaxID=573 RepID=A0A2X3D8R6_KLEPN|nr:Uncharacterised protein [Klebsiella pneumoniae]
MASIPAFACCKAWPPVSAPRLLTYPFFASPCSRRHSFAAPSCASVHSGFTEPRNFTTSSAL